MSKPKLKTEKPIGVTPSKDKPASDIAIYMSEENTGSVEAQEDASIQEQPPNEAVLPEDSSLEEGDEPLHLPLVSQEFDPDQARTKKHPTEGALFKALIIFVGLGFIIFLFKAFFGGLKGPPSVAPVVRELDEKPKVKADPSTDRTEIALVNSARERDAVAAQLAENKKKELKQKPKPEPKPLRQVPPPPQVTPVKVPPSRVPTPRRSYTPPPVVSSRPSPPPRPAPVAAPPVRQAPPPKVAPPEPEINRDMVAFGSLPDEGNPGQPEPSDGAINVDNRSSSQDGGLSDREQQQQAFVSGQTFVSSGTVIPGEVSDQALAADQATFTITTQQAVPGIPEGSEVVAQVTELSDQGHMTATAISVKNSDGSQSPIPPSAVKVTRPNGKLLKASSGGGLFKGQLGRTLLSAAGGVADQVTSRSESFTQNSFGTSTTRGAGDRDLTSIALSAVGGIAEPLLEQPQESGEKALLINPGKSVVLKVSQSFSVL